MDVGGVAVVKLVGQPVIRAQNGLCEPGEQLLRRICVVPEALAELTIKTRAMASGVGQLVTPRREIRLDRMESMAVW